MTPSQLHWLVPEPDFNNEFKFAQNDSNEPSDRFNTLRRLANSRLDFVQTMRLNRILDELEAISVSRLEPLKLALLGSCTIEHLVPAIRIAGVRRGLAIDVYVCRYGQIRQEILDPNSPLYQFEPDVALISFDFQSACLSLLSSNADPAVYIDQYTNEITRLWDTLKSSATCSVIQQTVMNLSPMVLGSLDTVLTESRSALIANLNAALRQQISSSRGTMILDLDRWSIFAGIDQWFDPMRWHQAKQEIAPQAAPMYGDLVARVLGALKGRSKKCLVLDLDNTLWGGVIGDDGLDGIQLGQGNAKGEAFSEFQGYIKLLGDHGVILAVCSKNDEANAREPFLKHPDMVLKLEDFSIFIANWDDKVTNLDVIAKTLNIGLDSLVFFDDNPAERDLVRRSLPMVAVPEPPTDLSGYVRCIADAGYFESISFTTDDRSRTEQYRANVERARAEQSHGNIEDFLESLDMTLIVTEFDEVDMARNHQLVNKTNQFNLTTRRHSRETMDRFKNDPQVIALQFRLTDKFGDNGIISIVILTPCDPPVADTLEIDTFVMSCRVFGRKVEMEIMNCIVEYGRRHGITTLRGEFRPTAKNGLCRDYYQRCGFERLMPVPMDDIEQWNLSISDFQKFKTPIEVRKAIQS